LTTFASYPVVNGFEVNHVADYHLLSGNCLFEPVKFSLNELRIAVNMLIDSVTFDFATNPNQPNAAHLLFFSSGGDTMASSLPDGQGGFGGTLTFSSPSPFTAFTVEIAAPGPEFGIDNLRMHPVVVPESSSLVLLVLGIGMLAFLRPATYCLRQSDRVGAYYRHFPGLRRWKITY
jgi:hypothetical protein